MFVSQIIDEASEILATTDQSKVFRKLTQAVQTLMESGHYFHTQQEVDVCTGWDGQTITLPRGIEVPLGVNIDGSPTYFRGRLFQYHVNKGGMYNPVDWAWDDRGFVATQMDIRQPSQLIAVSEHSADAGLTIRVIGTDSNNRELRSQDDAGNGRDGIMVPIHAQGDFPLGSIVPDGITINTRSVNVSFLYQFASTNHQLSSGQAVVLTSSGTAPSFLIKNNTYYVGVDDSSHIKLYNSLLDAQNGINPIALQSIVGSSAIKLTDKRTANLNTTINLLPSSGVVPVTIDSPNEVTFSTSTDSGFSGSLPSPLMENVTYFAQSQDDKNLQIYSSLSDAQANANPVYMSGNSGKFNTDIRKLIAPNVTLTFAVQHYYQNGDEVQAYTAGGSLPSPLISGQNYFVHVVDLYTISIHSTQADATTGNNPINLTDSGSGTNSLVKLIPATSNIGQTNQITAPGLQLSVPPGAGAQYQAVVVGSVIRVDMNSGANGSKYTSAPSVTFSAPPDPPVGSGQSVTTATGYAQMVLDAATSSTYMVASIVITNSGLGYTTAPTITIGAPPSGGTQAAATATIQTSFVSKATQVSGGYGYTQPPQVVISGGGGTGATASATINNSTITISSLTSIGTTATAYVANGHAYITGQTTQISGATPNGYNGNYGIVVPTIDQDISYALTGSGTTASVALVGHGYVDGQSVTISGANQVYYNGTFVINVVNPNLFTYQTTSTIAVSPATGILILASIPNPKYFTYTLLKSVGNVAATGLVTAYSGNVTAITIITEGTGYTSKPVITITSSTGVFIEFSSTGNLPSPLVSGTAYRAELPFDSGTGTFTLKNTDFSPVNITSAATGNLYVALARSFRIGFTNYWSGDFSGLPTIQNIYLASDYLLPTGVSSNKEYWINKINSTTCKIYDNQANAIANTDTGLQTIIALGSGQAYYAIRIPSYAQVYNNLVIPSSTQYLKDGMLVQFQTTGIAPYPLNPSNSSPFYTITLSGNGFKLKDSNNADVVFYQNGKPSLGSGILSVVVARDFTALPSTTITTINGLFETGDVISVRPNSPDVLPTGLVESTMSAPQYYYVRDMGNGLFELHATRSGATSGSNSDRISFQDMGNSVSSTFFVDSILQPTLVKSVLHIEKPITQGYVSLYAYDYGRSNDMALIGQYHPSETNPKYRRIRTGKNCSWARIIYRMKAPEITSVYDYIPLENTRAIIAAVHACDLEDKDFFEQSQRYWATALGYLKSQNESMEGHAMKPPQINNITYGDYTDEVMF